MGAMIVRVTNDMLARVTQELSQIANRIAPTLSAALNATVRKAKTDMSSAIREKVRIKKKEIDPYLSIELAGPSNLQARLTVNESKRLPLKYFVTSTSYRPRGGLKYKIGVDDAPKALPRGFRRKDKDDAVFLRAGKERVPIKAVRGISAWGVVVKAGIGDDIGKLSEDELEKQIDRRVNFELLRASGALPNAG